MRPKLLAADIERIDILVDRKGSKQDKQAWHRIALWLAQYIDMEIRKK